MKIAVIGFLALLTACGTDSRITPAETVLTACQTFNSALATITAQNLVDPLSANKVMRVDQAIELSDGVCDGPAPDLNATALDIAAVQGATLVLNAVMGD